MKVSVGLITYNHEKFIAQALDSILMQVTDFDYEIVVGEDFSSDKTRLILDGFQHRYPDKIKLIYRNENIGLKKNFTDLIEKCLGQYIAVLSGDDYWTDPYKLQKQASFLDHNPDYVMIGHNAIIVDEINSKPPGLLNKKMKPYDLSTSDLMLINPFVASEVMFRNFLVKEFPPVYFLPSGEDRRFYLLLSQFGKCRFEYDVTGVYRIHGESITSKSNTSYRTQLESLTNRIDLAREWNAYFGYQYNKEQDLATANFAKRIVNFALQNWDFKTALNYVGLIKEDETAKIKNRVVYKILNMFASKKDL